MRSVPSISVTKSKQTCLDSFFGSARRSTRRKKLKKDTKGHSFANLDIIDLCQDSDVETNENEPRTSSGDLNLKQIENPMSETKKCHLLKNNEEHSICLDLQMEQKIYKNSPLVLVGKSLDSKSYQLPVQEEPLKKRNSNNSEETKSTKKTFDSMKSNLDDKSKNLNEETVSKKDSRNENLLKIVENILKFDEQENKKLSSKLSSSQILGCSYNEAEKEETPRKKRPGQVISEKNDCPSYKVIEGTTFAVDAFNFGRIKDVTAYILTHFHVDHYVGLTKKFSMPIYASKITIDLIQEFISVDESLLNVLSLNTTVTIEGVQITAIEANHCPGAVMILFQLPCGKRILHTGDFRWSKTMELDPYLEQKTIDILYLDTTHISDKRAISSQADCISRAIQWVGEFKELNAGKRILHVVCTDVIGKENFWLSIAQAFDFKVWSDGKRKKCLKIIGNEEILKKLVSNPQEADLHVVSQTEAGYKHIDDYFRKFSDSYDLVLAIKPKGSDTIVPEYGGKINSISIRYSEHSTHKELRSFLGFLLPKRVISTVPLGKNIFRCPKVPVSWHTKQLYVPYKKQVSISKYFDVKER